MTGDSTGSKNAERIYRSRFILGLGNQIGCFSPLQSFRSIVSHIETGALLSSWCRLALKGNDTNETSFWCPVNAITPEYASVFDFQMLEGRLKAWIIRGMF